MKTNLTLIIIGIVMIGELGFLISRTFEKEEVRKEIKEEIKTEWSFPELIEFLENEQLHFTVSGKYAGDLNFIFEEGEINVQIRESVENAIDRAGSRGNIALAWGRFYFHSETPELLVRMKDVLDNNTRDKVYYFNRDISPNRIYSSEKGTDILKKIQLVKSGTGFDAQGNIFLPRIAMKWKNISNKPIKASVKIEVVFVDKNRNEELSRSSKYLHKFSETPMSVNISKQFYLTSSVGWSISSLENKNVVAEIYVNNKLFKKIKIENREIEIWTL